jgi:glycosyltransferase involved in cell wall biosynthesis
MHSIVLTVHNKDWLLPKVLRGIVDNTVSPYELVIVLDGCTDSSEQMVENFIKNTPNTKVKVVETPDVFETKANNAGLKECEGDKVIIVQDDMVIKESGWNDRLEKPFDEFIDVFAVTARSAFNYRFNQNSVHANLSEEEDLRIDNCWSDIFGYESHTNRDEGLSRNVFAVRNNVCRGPLMIDHADMIKLNYFDEIFAPQDQDDADLCYRAFKELGKIVGAYWIDYESDNSWGSTRPDGKNPASWLLKAHHKNTRIVFDRHKDIIFHENHDQNRVLK